MTFGRWILRSLRHYWRAHLGVMLGCMVASMTLVGALVLGDSVKASLRDQALARVGRVDLAVHSFDRFFRDQLAQDMGRRAKEQGDARTFTAALVLRGVGKNPDSEVLATQVQVVGVDDDFFALAPDGEAVAAPGRRELDLNRRLAQQLGVKVGDDVVLRVEKPSALPRDQTFSLSDDVITSLAGTVRRVVDEEGFGSFGLSAGPTPPDTAFVSREWLQERVERTGRSNLLLSAAAGDDSRTPAQAEAAVRRWLAESWTLADAELWSRTLDGGIGEIGSDRIFVDTVVGETAARLGLEVVGILSYFVNSLEAEGKATPYSSVSAVGLLSRGEGEPTWKSWAPIADPDLGAGEVVINRWLADDLGIGAGARLGLDYFVVGDGGKLTERSATLRVRGVVPLEGALADRRLMPDFPGLADKRDCSEWDPGIPVDLDRIRDQDEQYWDDHGGTPKAFVSLAEGRRLWANRFGDLTALRVQGRDLPALEAGLRERLHPEDFGLELRSLRAAALAGASPATDFGSLFLSLGVFLIAAALLLASLLFSLGIEQRASQIGLLLAVGYTTARVRLLMIAEAGAVAGVGALLGIPLGILYTKAVLQGLGGAWAGAVAGTRIELALEPVTGLSGAVLAALTAAAVLAWSLRKQIRRPAVELLHARGGVAAVLRPAGWGARLGAVGGLVAAVALLFTAPQDGPARAGVFFGAGSLLLISGLCALRWMMGRAAQRPGIDLPRLSSLAWRGVVRRPGRSLATVALLASGAFMVMAVGVNRQGPPRDPTARASGTGGFTLFAQSSLPVLLDLEKASDREQLGMREAGLEDVHFVPMRVREGDEASCLNLGSAQQPLLAGVDPAQLATREAFSFASTLQDTEGSPWRLLDLDLPDGAVPAIGDAASVTWALHKSVGDTLEYVDERGQAFSVMIVGTVRNSILQGNLLISESRFVRLFPSEPGYRSFLIDTPRDHIASVQAVLSEDLQDLGLEVRDAAGRLDEFNAVQNTYLSIFQTLGALGMLVGSAGVGVVVLRNVLERRAELAVARAVGYRRSTVRRLVWMEHASLLGLGLALGSLAAFLAVLPALGDRESSVVPTALGVFLALSVSGFLWVGLASVWAVRGRLLDDLSSE